MSATQSSQQTGRDGRVGEWVALPAHLNAPVPDLLDIHMLTCNLDMGNDFENHMSCMACDMDRYRNIFEARNNSLSLHTY